MTEQPMRAAVCRKHGPPEALVVESVAQPEPGPGEVLVRVGAAAVNFPDVLIVADGYLLASGRVAPHIDAVYPLGEVAGALRKVADRQSAGKVLVDPTR